MEHRPEEYPFCIVDATVRIERGRRERLDQRARLVVTVANRMGGIQPRPEDSHEFSHRRGRVSENLQVGRLAQLGERLVYTQEVGGSIPSPPIHSQAFLTSLPPVVHVEHMGRSNRSMSTALLCDARTIAFSRTGH